ncbi:4-hydroxyphenylacetate 3-hydroxylase [Desulfurococcaceae archaeon AG1]|nr:MAG: 4-hydroxyphenylacetate 3-hydroxylase [Desulfurococcaceae archaeon]GAY25962.1 4-hydroxyphenylacetate 3-hydroxylase [Desulfurococcaceae archaeon AG1]
MIRRGEDYIRSIREGNHPVVYYDGKIVENIADHPAFRIPVRTTAEYYDLHWDPGKSDKLRHYSPMLGEEVSISFMIPKSKSDLRKLAEGLMTIYDYYRGFFGRSPDYLNLWSAVFAAHSDYFAKHFGSRYGENAIEIYKQHAKKDLFFTHAIVAPMYDRSKPPSQWPDPYIWAGVVKETNEGVIVRGAAMISTSAAYAEWLWYLPNIRRDTDPRYAIFFAIPTNTKGIKVLARRGFEPRSGYSEFEYPISSKYEESDGLLIFDDVLVPWENIIFYKKPEEIENFMWHEVRLRSWFNWHFVIQHYCRLKFLAGLAISVAQAAGIDSFINVQEKLGEILIYLALNEAAIYGSIELAEELPNIVRPNAQIAIAASHFNMKALPRANEILRLISAGASIPIPASIKDFENPEERAYIEKYLAMKGINALERVKLFNLLWDVIGSEVGMRYEQYDRFSRGDPTIRWAQTYTEVYRSKHDELKKIVKEILDQMPNPKQ